MSPGRARDGLPQLLAALALAGAPALAAQERAPVVVRHRAVVVDGLRIAYREAGPADAPAVLLLHGFPSSSFMFRGLIPRLATRLRVVAPDYPGFGASDFPPREEFPYTFARLTEVVRAFTQAVGLERYALYVQDYGAPVGLRLALLEPARISALIVQNGNAYAQGLSAEWEPLQAYWREPTRERRETLRGWLTPEGVELQYAAGLAPEERERLAPELWTLDWARLARPGNADAQLDLFADYRTNVELYPRFQAFFRERRPPTLVVWGARDPFFTPAGAEAYRRDLPAAEIHLLEKAGHFALETHLDEVAPRVEAFLARQLLP